MTRYHDRIMLDPVIGILIVASFATLFASAAIHKLRDLARFDAVFAAYGLPRGGAGSWADFFQKKSR